MSQATMTPPHDVHFLRPGLLMTPLGWLGPYLANALRSDLELSTMLFEVDAFRMHGLGLGLAHLEGPDCSPAVIKLLMRGPPQTALQQILGRSLLGLNRALRALPDTAALERESYRSLATLLMDRATATYLHHCQAITEPLVQALAVLPPQLRQPGIFKLLDDVDGVDRFVVGLQFLCDRATVSFDSFVEQLGALDQAEQVKARIIKLAERLPLPDRLPSARLGSFQRIDDPSQIRSLSRSWRNCLVEHLYEVNEGTALVYHSDENAQPAAALLTRAHRLGWALVDIKGPKNIEIDKEAASSHYATFAAGGIPRLADIAAIRSILWDRRFLRR